MGTEQRANGHLGTETSTDAERMERFFQAFEYLSNHPIFQTEPAGEEQLTESQARYWGLGNEPITATILPTVDFWSSLDVDVVKVNPETGEIDEDPSNNTKVQFRLGTGPYDSSIDENASKMFGRFTHDADLDSAGDTFEDAVIELADRVRIKYPQTPIDSTRPSALRRVIFSGDAEASLTSSIQT